MTNTGGSGAPELTLKQIADSATVRRASRIISILLFPAIGAVGGYFLTLDHRISAIEVDRAARIIANNSAQKDISESVSDLQSDVAVLKGDVAGIKLDVATVKGILQEMQRSRQAVFDVPPRVIATVPSP